MTAVPPQSTNSEEDKVTPEEITALFTRSDGDYVFARWGRPIAPVVFGVEDQTLAVVKGAFEAVVSLAGHQLAETDPELGANTMMFFFRGWQPDPFTPVFFVLSVLCGFSLLSLVKRSSPFLQACSALILVLASIHHLQAYQS